MIFIPCFPFLAKAQHFSFSLETSTGFMFGQTHEYVYHGDRQISRLEWEQNAVPYIHAALNLEYQRFFIRGAVRAAVPVSSGVMRNHDYLLPNSNALTHFSQHDNFMDRHNDYSIGIGYRFSIGNWSISPSLGFLHSNRKWTASDGFLRYAPPGTALQGDEPIIRVTGPVATYEMKISYFYAALAASYSIRDRFQLGINFKIFPYIWAEALDHHILRSIEFLDTMPGGIGGSLGLTFVYRPRFARSLEFIVGCTFEKLFKQKGSTAQRQLGVGANQFVPNATHSAGYSSRLWSIFIGTRLTTTF